MMAYFSNSTDGAQFEDAVCSSCAHKPKDEDSMCPVIAAHMVYQGERAAQGVLDMLIVRDKDTMETVCQLYIEAPNQVPWKD